jgi:hypothetical protein
LELHRSGSRVDAVVRPRELAAKLDELMFVWQTVSSGAA